MAGRTKGAWPLAVAAAAFLVNAGALRNGFALDDLPLVRDNSAIASLSGALRLFVRPYWDVPGESYGLYRPLTTLSFSVNRAVAGAAPLGFHVGNLLLHAAASALAWFALRRAGTRYGTALAGALLFAVHPVHVEAVANVAGRSEILAGAFALAAWLAHRRWVDGVGRPGRWAAAAGGAYLAAVLSKEGAVLAPLLFLADDAMRARETERRGPGWAARALPYAAALVALVVLRGAALGWHQGAASALPLDNPTLGAGVLARILTALWVQARYLALVLWPGTLVSDYGLDAVPLVTRWADPRAIVGAAAVALVAAGALWGWRRSRPVALASLVWIVFLLPSSNLLFPAGTLMAERLLYLPILGPCLLAGHLVAGVAAIPGRPFARRARLAAVTAVVGTAVVALSLRTIERVPAWKDNATLAVTDVRTEPRSAKLQAGAAIALAAAGRRREAEEHLRRAIEIYPDYAQCHYNLGVLLVDRGALAEGETHLRRALALAPDNPRPREALVRLLRREGRSGEAATLRPPRAPATPGAP